MAADVCRTDCSAAARVARFTFRKVTKNGLEKDDRRGAVPFEHLRNLRISLVR